MTNSADPDQWLLQKPTDLDLHCLQRKGISGFSRTRVKIQNVDDNTNTTFFSPGEKLTFTYWADGEPSKLFGFLSLENCACMRRSDGWRWHDYHCHAPGVEYKFICQFGKF